VVLTGAGDDVELLGATAYTSGAAVEHVGTTGAVLTTMDAARTVNLPAVEVAPTASPMRVAAAASTSNCGTVLDWIQKTFALEPAAVLAQAPAPGDPLATAGFWPPRDGSGRSNNDIAGLGLAGIHPHHTTRDMARALLVRVAGELRTCLRNVEDATGEIETIVSSGGRDEPAWVALRASTYDRPITTLDADPTALGCVALALVALGEHSEVGAAAASIPVVRTVTAPDPAVVPIVEELLAQAENAHMPAKSALSS
jgi:erythritol kinase (D-erythritol 1-phosphate-forming)